MSSSREHKIAVVGAGPRGTSFLERLLAHLAPNGAALNPRIRVNVFDPAPHGSGRVWDPEQSGLYLMNTPADFPTAVPTGGTQEHMLSTGLLSFADYARMRGLRYRDAEYPSRRDYGTYLTWLNKEISARLRGRGVVVDHFSEAVTSVTHDDDDGYQVHTPHGSYRADSVVFALGHVPAHQAGPSRYLAAAAADMNLHYQGPAIPTDVDFESYLPGENVLVRGLGLNFFDVMIQLTAGRGGRFKHVRGAAAGRRLEYIASGREPLIIAGSRRGTPYHSKTTAPGYVTTGTTLSHLTDEAVDALLDEHEFLDFTTHLWPLILADVQDAYVRAGGAPAPEPGQLAFDIQAYARPFQHQDFASHADYQDALVQWLTADAAASEAGYDSPEKMAVAALHAARLRVKPLITSKRLTAHSRVKDVEGWFESLAEGLASGPPLQRIEELSALARAGVVEFIGPDPVYGVDRQEQCFIADSAAVAGVRYRARHMIEAMMPPNRVTQSSSPLVEGLLSSGTARPAQFTFGGETHLHKGFDVTEQPHQLIDAQGKVHHGLYVLGLQLSSAQWGTAIAAESGGDPDTTARPLADADAAARDVLSRSHGTAAPHAESESTAADLR